MNDTATVVKPVGNFDNHRVFSEPPRRTPRGRPPSLLSQRMPKVLHKHRQEQIRHKKGSRKDEEKEEDKDRGARRLGEPLHRTRPRLKGDDLYHL